MRIVVSLVLLAALAQAPPPADGVITGRVVNAVPGRPVSGVVVSVSGAGMTVMNGTRLANQPRILTGGDGRFVFRGLEVPGTFAVSAIRNGYAEGASGRLRPGGSSESIELAPGAPSTDIVVRVWKNGAIAGTVIDEA